jgi:hypothetical protein
LLLPLLRGFTPASRTEHIPKYSSIEKIIKLPFQRVIIRLNRSQWGSYGCFTLALLAVQNFSMCNHRWFGHIRL